MKDLTQTIVICGFKFEFQISSDAKYKHSSSVRIIYVLSSNLKFSFTVYTVIVIRYLLWNEAFDLFQLSHKNIEMHQYFWNHQYENMEICKIFWLCNQWKMLDSTCNQICSIICTYIIANSTTWFFLILPLKINEKYSI